jgi:hypothetical protein
VYVDTFFIQLRSAPAENTSPAPVSTMTRTLSSLAMTPSASVSSLMSTSSNAFFTEGRSSVTRATGPWFSSRNVVYVIRSHPEHAEAMIRDRRVE